MLVVRLENVTDVSTSEKSIFSSCLDREKLRFDPGICVIIVVVLGSMLIGNEWHRQVFIQRIITHYQEQREATKISVFSRFKDSCLINIFLFIGFFLIFIFNRYKFEVIDDIHRTFLIVGSAFVLFYFLQSIFHRFPQLVFRLVLMIFSIFFVLFSFVSPVNLTTRITTNIIFLVGTIVIISRMRLANFLHCSIIFANLWLFEIVVFILRWTNIFDVLFRFENENFDDFLSGGTLFFVKRRIDENLTLVLTFFKLRQRNDACDIDQNRMFFALDDLIFPSLAINFCRIFDLGNQHRFPIYYFQILFSYVFSLCIAFVTMFSTKFDQLFSIFIYPTIFISTFVTALSRGECRKLFLGTLTKWKRPQRILTEENSF